MTKAKTNKSKPITSAARHPCHKAELINLKRIKGQVEGIENMILDGRYCPDILLQFQAVISALASTKLKILERHIRHCLLDAVRNGNKKDTEMKIEEIVLILSRK